MVRVGGAPATRSPITCYDEGCSHDECRIAANRARRDRRRLQNRPDSIAPLSTVPAGIVRAHIAELRASGLGLATIASRAGVSEPHLRRIVSGETKRVTPAVKDRILGVLSVVPAPGAYVDSAPTMERLADLAAAGFGARDVAREAGLPLSTVRSISRGAKVRARIADAIAALHEVAGLAAPELAGEEDYDDPLAEWRLMLDEIGDQTWRKQAECRRLDAPSVRDRVNVFFPGRGDDVEVPREICARCPVRSECLDYAHRTRTLIGFWGGTSGADRRALRHADVVAAREDRVS